MVSQEWHWEQAIKFAAESIKTTLLLNGAAAIALMTFAATRKFSGALHTPLVLFAVGAMLSAFAFLAAYLCQVEYGNAVRPGIGEAERDQSWKKARHRNWAAIIIVILSAVAFFGGIILTGVALPKLEPLAK
jgi:hypothetical protein